LGEGRQGLSGRLREGLGRAAKHPRARALLDDPKVFKAVRYPLVGAQKRTKELVRRELGAGPEDSVLDVCCGTGDFAGVVDGPYLGVDLNERFVGLAKERYAGNSSKRFEVMDATRMRLDAGSFDRAMIVNAMHHFDDDLNRGILAELSRVVRERIVIVDAIPDPEGWLSRLVIQSDRGDHVRPLPKQLGLIAEQLNIERHYTFESGFIVQVMFVCSPMGER
jgi:ubiquinone/menaquinone biosynthesis C-methylase UbiE